MRNQNLRKETRHGTISGYQHHKCRCGACKQAKKEYEKKRVLLKTPEIVGPKPINHGTPAAYSYHGCRCDLCLTKGRNEYLMEIAA